MSGEAPSQARSEETPRPKGSASPVASTFIPPTPQLPPPALDSLPTLSLAGPQETAAPELALKELIGEGGRGEVRLARQLPLRRDVAVKSLKDAAAPGATIELLREARITGNLEHPNVVPVYALGRDSQGRVLLVMKKVSGASWGELLRRENCPRSDAQLERHLEIFLQVCNAVEFAHSQGIVHRDLKPANVMVGAFGEVVVLDWGLAVCLAGDPKRDLPPASAHQGLAGTPAYMPPELARGDGNSLGIWTDIYLLGAILHEIATGTPPHQAPDLPTALQHALSSAPIAYGQSVAAELAEICRRSMDPDVSRRFSGVAEMRQAVHDFGRHRQSALLADEARRRLEGPADAETAIAQSHFGFEQALRMWPQNPVALEGLQTAGERKVELELSRENLAGAVHALAELPAPRPELASAVEALRAKQSEQSSELERLRALENDLNPDLSAGALDVLLLACGLLWCVVPICCGWFERRGIFSVTYRDLTWGWVFFAVSTALGIALGRRTLLSNRMGRQIATCAALLVGSTGIIRICAGLWGRPVDEALGFEVLSYFMAAAFAAIFVDTRFSVAAAVYALAGVLVARQPDLTFFIIGCANFFALVPMVLLWNRVRQTACEAFPARSR